MPSSVRAAFGLRPLQMITQRNCGALMEPTVGRPLEATQVSFGLQHFAGLVDDVMDRAGF